MYLLHRKNIDIYANISLFLSYSEVPVATRTGPYPAQMVTAVTRSSLYSDQMVDQHLEMTSTAPTALNISGDRTPRWAPETDPQWGPRHLDSHREKTTGTSWALTIWLCGSWKKLLVLLARGELAPPDWSWFLPRFFSLFCRRWSFDSLPLSPLACSVGDTSFPAISSSWLHRYYLNWTELDDDITEFNNEMPENVTEIWVLNLVIYIIDTLFSYFDIVQLLCYNLYC